MHVVVTGTSRGIGLELVRLALEAGHQVVAVARRPQDSAGLAALQAAGGDRLKTLAADLLDPGAPALIAGAVRESAAVDVLVNNAGILRETARREDFMDSFAVNTVAPFAITQALLPSLRKSSQPRVIHVTSKMGSIADNTSGSYYAYRSSKAALNMISRSLARDHDWLTSVVVHPGWAQTDMGGPQATVPVAESARGIWRLASGAKRQDSGRFFDYLGKELPW
ncbi:MAG TPA: SDR family oxidoreductase [Steroidobacteraceae bacterium]|nr:SDR family oxidoreductase [Steroidobacteraceae bacterium]